MICSADYIFTELYNIYPAVKISVEKLNIIITKLSVQ